MAENETLDLWDRHSRRWQGWLNRIENGGPKEQIADEAIRCLHRAFKNVVKLLPVERLLEAAKRDDQTIHDVVRECPKARDYAEMFEQLAVFHSDPAALVESVLRATVEKFFDQVALRVVGGDYYPSLPHYRIMRESVKMLMRDGISRLARKIADHPNEEPRMPPRSADQREKDQRDLQKQSLLPRSGTHG